MTEPMSTAEWKDHFSHASDDYRRWRPGYPRELFDWLAAQCPATDLAWDCATGNGQAAVELARKFRRVVATDASIAQIAEAEPAGGVEYLVAPAEQSPLPDASADLVTVAQALHWFDVERFHAEVRRVLRPGGILAEWGYGLAYIAPPIDVLVLEFSAVTVGPFWPPERALVESAYSTVPFPFPRLETPEFAMTASWSLDRFLAYIGTWSSVAGYRRAHGSDPVPALGRAIEPLWGDGERDVRWPLLLRVGRR
jgi:ubiquinone/menaquinone biosynthesis C-methylase UbiE